MLPTIAKNSSLPTQTEIIENKLSATRELMAKNVEKITSNLMKAEDLEQDTSELCLNAQQFKKQSVSLKRVYWWKNFRVLWVLIIVSLIVLLALLGGIIALVVVNI
ncbi:V-SNARE coiled-coil-like proteiny domain-containing protein [Entamoeba marina]